jgi:hypothetical protein
VDVHAAHSGRRGGALVVDDRRSAAQLVGRRALGGPHRKRHRVRRLLGDDFHSDGSLAASTSSGPQNGTWTWEATFTTPQRVLHGAIQWRRDGTGFRQGFGRLLGPSFRETSYASCRRASR